MRRREFLVRFGSAAASTVWPCISIAQTHARRVGFLHPGITTISNFRISAFRQGLGDNVEVIARVAEGNIEKLPALAAELLDLSVEAILAVSPTAVRAAKATTKSVPIVAVDLESDPVASAFVASLARPGGNLTGIFLDLPEFSAKLLQLLREAVPTLSKIAIIWDPETGTTQLNEVRRAGAALGLTPTILEVRRAADFSGAFDAMETAGVDGLLLLSTPLVSGNIGLLADLASRKRVPAITLFPEFAQNGGLLGYGPELQALFRQSGVMMRKILLGAKPIDLPVERPTRFQLVANLKVARGIGVTLPTSILLRADDVVE